MKRRPFFSRIPKTFRKPWNASTLVMAIVAIGLMLTAVFSIHIDPSRTGDYLEITNSKQQALFHKNKKELGLLQRKIQKPVAKPETSNLEPGQVNPMKVKVGIYATNNFEIDPNTPSFKSIGYVWFKWQDDLQNYLVENNLEIWKVMVPINLLDIPESSDSVFTPTSEPIRMDDGSWYLTGSYSGTFYIDDTDFRRYPFARLSLPIMIEADNIRLDYDMLRIEPDLTGSGIGQFVNTSVEWVNTGWSLNSYRHQYDTGFGFEDESSSYSQLVFDTKYATNTWTSFWKILVPVSIVMAMIVGATKLDPVHYDVRLTMPVTVLLTLVFLQQGHDGDLPRLSYLTFLDEVYLVSYILTLGSFSLMLWACRRYYYAIAIKDKERRELELRRLDKSDDYWPTYVILAATVSIAISWFTI